MFQYLPHKLLTTHSSKISHFCCLLGWHDATLLREENGEKLAYNILTEAFKQHEQSLLKQLLSMNALPVCWSDVIIPLVDDIVNSIRPGIYLCIYLFFS